jgi:hypothetical protein
MFNSSKLLLNLMLITATKDVPSGSLDDDGISDSQRRILVVSIIVGMIVIILVIAYVTTTEQCKKSVQLMREHSE